MELVPGAETRRNNWINMGRNRGNTILEAKRQQAIETKRYQVKLFNILQSQKNYENSGFATAAELWGKNLEEEYE